MAIIDATKPSKRGKIIRLSRELELFINRKRKGKEGYDATLRRLFGLPTIKGKPQPLFVAYVIQNNGKPVISMSKAEARGEAILLATKRGHKKAETVLTVTERL
jgi:hypothetical protein